VCFATVQPESCFKSSIDHQGWHLLAVAAAEGGGKVAVGEAEAEERMDAVVVEVLHRVLLIAAVECRTDRQTKVQTMISSPTLTWTRLMEAVEHRLGMLWAVVLVLTLEAVGEVATNAANQATLQTLALEAVAVEVVTGEEVARKPARIASAFVANQH
jgi:hypothetical protein